jgi:hypothetical protein
MKPIKMSMRVAPTTMGHSMKGFGTFYERATTMLKRRGYQHMGSHKGAIIGRKWVKGRGLEVHLNQGGAMVFRRGMPKMLRSSVMAGGARMRTQAQRQASVANLRKARSRRARRK